MWREIRGTARGTAGANRGTMMRTAALLLVGLLARWVGPVTPPIQASGAGNFYRYAPDVVG